MEAEERTNRRHHRRRRRLSLALPLRLFLLLLLLQRRPLELQRGEAGSAPLEEVRQAWRLAGQLQQQQLLRYSHLAAVQCRQRRRPRPLDSPPLPLLPLLLRRSPLAPQRSLEEEEETQHQRQPRLLALEDSEAGRPQQQQQHQRLQLLRSVLAPPLLPKLLPLPLLSPPPLARHLHPLAPLPEVEEEEEEAPPPASPLAAAEGWEG